MPVKILPRQISLGGYFKMKIPVDQIESENVCLDKLGTRSNGIVSAQYKSGNRMNTTWNDEKTFLKFICKNSKSYICNP